MSDGSEIALCSETRNTLDADDMMKAVRIGSEIIPVVPQNSRYTISDTAVLEIQKKIDLRQFSCSLLFGPVIILSTTTSNEYSWDQLLSNSQDFYTLSITLAEQRCGLLVTTMIDISTGQRDKTNNLYYMLIGDTLGTSIMMQRVITANEYVPQNFKVGVTSEKRSDKVVQLIDNMAPVEYTPLNYSTMQHERISSLITNGTPIFRQKNKKPVVGVIHLDSDDEIESVKPQKKPSRPKIILKPRSNNIFSSLVTKNLLNDPKHKKH
jgi:hypothetical protein